jgi:tRNA(Arg) A34 adenosine deaminase TadA
MNVAFKEAFGGIRNNHGGPFGAVIVKDNVIIGKGCNMVVSNNDPTAHAEIVAIREACNNINSYDLSGSLLFSTCEPCPMCLSAVYWANIKQVIFSLSRYDAELMGFKDKNIYREINLDQSERTIKFRKVDHPSIKDLMEEWNLKADKSHY